jgi:DNA-directed RNA polymerase beta' subunit
MTLKNRTIKVNKDKSLSKIHYGKKDIWWFFQWLKVCVDLEGSSIEFNKSRKKGGSYGSATGTIKQKITITGWKEIDLKEIKSMKHHLKMTDKELFSYLNKMFNKYIHLFGDFTIRYVKTPKDLIQDDNYFTVQIPLSKNRVEIDTELEKLKEVNKIAKSEKTRTISFYRTVKHKELNTLYKIWSRKNKDFEWGRQGNFKRLNNSEIARQVGYKGYRQVQLAYVSAKNLIVNMSNGIFPKNKP